MTEPQPATRADQAVVELLDQLAMRARAVELARGEVERTRAELDAEKKRTADVSSALAHAEQALARAESERQALQRAIAERQTRLDRILSSRSYRMAQVVSRIARTLRRRR